MSQDKQSSPAIYRPDEAAEGDAIRDGDGARGVGSDEDRPKEIGGRKGPDPTRYGDWEKNGRCIDF